MSTFRFNTTFVPAKGLLVTWIGGVRKAVNASGALVDFASLDATARDAAKVAISADADLVQRHVSAAMTTLDPAPPAGIYEMEAWEAGQSMDEEPCALSVNQVYWDGEKEVDPATTITLVTTPIAVELLDDDEPVRLTIRVSQYDAFSYTFVVYHTVNGESVPWDLTGKSIAFTAYRAAGQANEFVLTTDGGGIVIGGDDGNYVVVSADDSVTQIARDLRFNLRNLTDDKTLAIGPLLIAPENDAVESS